MNRPSNYDKSPFIRVPMGRECVWQGWKEIISAIAGEITRGARRIAVEVYPGVFEEDVLARFADEIQPAHVFRIMHCWKIQPEIDAMVQRDLTEDPVFGRISHLTVKDFAAPWATGQLRERC